MTATLVAVLLCCEI